MACATKRKESGEASSPHAIDSLLSSLLKIEAGVVAGEYCGEEALQQIVATIHQVNDVTGVSVVMAEGADLIPCASALTPPRDSA